MTDQETTLLIQDIVNKALEGKERPFRYILYWSEYRYYRGWVTSTKIVIKALKQSANNLFKEYCKDVIVGISDITKLLAYQQLLDIIDFYEAELKTVLAMINDYDEYICNFSNFIRALFGERREV